MKKMSVFCFLGKKEVFFKKLSFAAVVFVTLRVNENVGHW